jgi:hypothetical protein
MNRKNRNDRRRSGRPEWESMGSLVEIGLFVFLQGRRRHRHIGRPGRCNAGFVCFGRAEASFSVGIRLFEPRCFEELEENDVERIGWNRNASGRGT